MNETPHLPVNFRCALCAYEAHYPGYARAHELETGHPTYHVSREAALVAAGKISPR